MALALGSCEGFGCNSEVVAELTSRNGNVERDFAKNMNYWENAPVHATFVTNDGVRTLPHSGAELTLVDGSLVVMKPKTQLRFANSIPEQKRFGVVVESGSAQIEAKSDDLEIATGIGLARLGKGSAITLRKNENQLAVQLDIGNAKFVANDGTVHNVTAGEEMLLDIGTAKLITMTDDQTTADAPGDEIDMDFEESGDTNENLEDERDENDDVRRSDERTHGIPDDRNVAEHADFKINVGERIFIHAMHAPVAVEFGFANICDGAGYVKISKKKIWGTGTGSVILNVPSRSHGYELHCIENGELGKTKARGRITVLHDKGKSILSLSAPVSYVDADGRDYNLLYQSKLPQVVVKWPDAPESSGYKLHLTGDSGTKSISLKSPQYRFSSGALEEGAYRFKFIADGSGKRSRTSSITIRFDNATPKAVLKSPRDEGYTSGAMVDISGVALPGWTASVYGKTLNMDAEHRFAGTAQHQGQYRSLPVKLTHRSRGTHYFLRRAR